MANAEETSVEFLCIENAAAAQSGEHEPEDAIQNVLTSLTFAGTSAQRVSQLGDAPLIQTPRGSRRYTRHGSGGLTRTAAIGIELASSTRRLHSLWYVGGCALAILTSGVSFSAADLGRPFERDSWWQCMLTCVTMWLGLALAFVLACLHHYAGLACELANEQGEGSLWIAEATSAEATNGRTSSSAVAVALSVAGSRLSWPGAAFVGVLSVLTAGVIWCVLYRAFEFPPFLGAWAALGGLCTMHLAGPFLVQRRIRTHKLGWLFTKCGLAFSLSFLPLNMVYWGWHIVYLRLAQELATHASPTTANMTIPSAAGPSAPRLGHMDEGGWRGALLGAGVVVAFACTKAAYKMTMVELFHRCALPSVVRHVLALPVFAFVQFQHTTYICVLFGSGSWQSMLVASAVTLLQKFVLELPFICGFVQQHWSTYAQSLVREHCKCPCRRKLSSVHHHPDVKSLPSVDAERTAEATQRRLSRESHLYFLAVGEVAGLLVPLTYSVIFTLVFFGKNGQYLGGIRSNMWHYRTPPSLEAFLLNTGILFGCKLTACVITTLAVKWSTGHSTLRVAAVLARKMSFVTVPMVGFLMYHQICVAAIHCGMDFTFGRPNYAGSTAGDSE
jgi:hypothetical protein